MLAVNACIGAENFFTENNLWGKNEDEVLLALKAANLIGHVDWWNKQKTTEAFVRFNGKEITMETTYQVFDPLVGTHTECQSESEAKIKLAEIIQVLIQQHNFVINQAISNENGDTTWSKTNLADNIEIVIK
jgi:hypothetical protein